MVEKHIGYQLKRAQHMLRLRMDEALAPLGLTVPQYAALSALETEDGLSNAEMARRCFVTAQTMNPIVSALEQSGSVRRKAHPAHGRVLQVFLTNQGRRLLARAHAKVFDVEARMLGEMPPEQKALLLQLLRGCADRLEERA